MRSQFGNGAWRCALCDVTGDVGNDATEEQTMAALHVHLATSEHRAKQAEVDRVDRIVDAAPEMLALLREIDQSNVAGSIEIIDEDVPRRLSALLNRIDGT